MQAEMFPEYYNNKTSGVSIVNEAIRDGWVTNLGQLEKLRALVDDRGFRDTEPMRDTLLTHAHHTHLADLASCLEADGGLCALPTDPDEWARRAILNVPGRSPATAPSPNTPPTSGASTAARSSEGT
jgi:glyoxylase-like metal-dependent hydrolase (beta-lactamase superfamily II)